MMPTDSKIDISMHGIDESNKFSKTPMEADAAEADMSRSGTNKDCIFSVPYSACFFTN
jgi:hypothetical protein